MTEAWEAMVERTLAFLSERKRAYKLTFPKESDHARYVLKDLAMACHLNEDCPHSDLYRLGEWYGAQKMFHRIARHLNLSPEELFAIYSGVRAKTKE